MFEHEAFETNVQALSFLAQRKATAVLTFDDRGVSGKAPNFILPSKKSQGHFAVTLSCSAIV